jgi:hypothetical protein
MNARPTELAKELRNGHLGGEAVPEIPGLSQQKVGADPAGTKKLSQNQRLSSFVPGSVGPPVAFATLCARSNTDGTDPTTRQAA